MNIAVIGAGLSGATIAFRLRCVGHDVHLFEVHDHVGGHCATKRDKETGIMVHTYGPHIFHTSNVRVWNFIRQFAEMVPYTHRVKAVTNGRVFSLPINLLTINQFFGHTFTPAEAERFVKSLGEICPRNPENFEEQALEFVGRDLYEAFFKDYTVKAWGRSPTTIPASVLKRLPIRFNYDDRYFDHPYQAIPKDGYTDLVEHMLDGVRVYLDQPFTRGEHSWDHIFYTGPLDAWFGYAAGRLPYRTLDFRLDRWATSDAQGAPVINYCNPIPAYTRITEYKHFMPWETHTASITCTEYSRECGPRDDPYYPIPPIAGDNEMLATYKKLAEAERAVTFVGRLATYRYIDMDVAIADALAVADKFLGSSPCEPART